MNTNGKYSDLRTEEFDAVLRVTLARQHRKNALSERLILELKDVISIAEQNQQVRVMILRGAGTSFCSGYDVAPTASSSSRAYSPVEQVRSVTQDNRVFDRLASCAIPTVVAIHGHCLAAGVDLAMSCDLIVCSTDACIGYPGTRYMGVPPMHTWLYHVGPQWAKRLLFSGDTMTGAKAAEIGFALEAVAPGDLDEHVLELATRLSKVPRDLLIANKYVVNRGLDLMGRRVLQEIAAMQHVLGRMTPEVEAFWRTVERDGLKRAIAEENARFDGNRVSMRGTE